MDAAEKTETQAPVSVIICDDHPIVSDALKIAVTASPSLVLAADPVSRAEELVAICRRVQPDVCVIDVNLGGEPDGIEATRSVRDVASNTKVLVLSAYTSDETILSAIEAGADGFVHKGEPVRSVLQAIVDVGRGRSVIDRDALLGLVHRASRERAERAEVLERVEQLTRREREVLELVRGGAPNDEIARRLFVSPRTVESHVQHILRKLGVHSRLEAVVLVSGVDLSAD